MEIHFDKEYLQQLYEEGKQRIRNIASASNGETISVAHKDLGIRSKYRRALRHSVVSLRSIEGDKAGISSIRVNDQYRIEFTVKQSTSETVVTICNILELSNHYK